MSRLRKAGVGLADQVVSSTSNFGLGVLCAQVAIDEREFGRMSVVFTVYLVLLGLTRAVTSMPVMVRHAAATYADQRLASQVAASTSVWVGLGGGLMLAAAIPFGGSYRGLLFALAVSLPLLLAQDAWRMCAFAMRRPGAALLSDGLWLVLQLGAFVALHLAGAATVTSVFASWALAGAVAGGIAFGQFRLVPVLGVRCAAWLKEHRDLGPSFALEFLVSTGTSYAVILALGGIAGAAAVGELRLALLALAPIAVMLTAVVALALPSCVRRLREGGSAGRLAFALSAVTAGTGTIWAAVLLFIPEARVLIIGDTLHLPLWPLAATAAFTLLGALATGPIVVIRAAGAAKTGLRVRLAAAPVLLGGGVAGGVLNGAMGAALGLTAGYAVAAVLWWRAALRLRVEPPDSRRTIPSERATG